MFLGLWPEVVESRLYPLAVRFQEPGQGVQALAVLRHLEVAWRAHREDLGFRPPLAYAPDGSGRFTAFIWRGFGAILALPGQRDVQKSHEAFETYLIVDPDGPGGGEALADTLVHEFHQAVTLGYSPWASPAFRAASATYAQDAVYDESNRYLVTLPDFQARPGWAIGYDDRFASFYAHGACLYLLYLRERHFPSDPPFLARIWKGLEQEPTDRSIFAVPEGRTTAPNWVGALSDQLPEGISFNATLIEFARWRYYTSDRADADHLSEAVLFPASAQILRRDLRVDTTPTIDSSLMATGSDYFRLVRSPSGNARPTIDFEGDPAIHWVLQVMPDPTGSSDGVAVIGSRLNFADRLELTLVVTALPRELYNPTVRSEEQYHYRLTLGRR
ncbi:MAG: hypothetical protein JW797_10990 [Bradymonadales bacterium]|nr:hypothetical protein [Bradymonadales bacterium]